MVEFLVSSGVHGIINGGSTGEYYAQSMDERVELAKLAKQVIGKRTALIIGTGQFGCRTPSPWRKLQQRSAPMPFSWARLPMRCQPNRKMPSMLAIDRAADLPIMLYNYPGRMGINMGEEFLDRVGPLAQFLRHQGKLRRHQSRASLARDYPHIQLSCGMDDQALEFFAWGARSWVCGGSNFLPQEHLALYKACVIEGKFDKGRRIMSAMLPLMGVLEQGGKFVQCIKHGCEMTASGPGRHGHR